MEHMATWEDGPEYAPWQRPDGFTTPPVPPLLSVEAAAPPHPNAPVARPHFDRPTVALTPLAALVPEPPEQRDPAVPFAVVSSTVTVGPELGPATAWSAAHGRTAPLDATATPALDGTPPPVEVPPAEAWAPVETSWPPPDQPLTPTAGPAALPGGFPSPGTPAWFSGPPPAPQPYMPPITARTVVEAASPALLITLGIGCLLAAAAPITLCVAAALSSRVQIAREAVRRAFVVALTSLAGIAVLIALVNDAGFGAWWAALAPWALLGSWVLVVVVVVTVFRQLKHRDQWSYGPYPQDPSR